MSDATPNRMIPKARLAVALCAVGLLLALLPAGASAATAGWMVGGNLLNGTEHINPLGKAVQKFKLNLGAIGLITCNTEDVQGENITISTPAMGLAAFLEFKGCTISSETCGLGQTTIKTNALLIEATLEGTLAVKTLILPETKNILINTILFTGETCAIAGNQPAAGRIVSTMPEGQDERTEQLIEISPSALVQVGTITATPIGSFRFLTETDKPWSFL